MVSFSIRVAETGEEVAHLIGGPFELKIPFSPDGKFLALQACEKRDTFGICAKGSIGIWDIVTGDAFALTPFIGEIYTLSFSPDGQYFITGGCDKFDNNRVCAQSFVRVWKTDTGHEVARLTHEDFVTLADFSPDGKYIISRSAPNTARVWEATTSKEVARITYPGRINLFAFNTDENSIISAGCDQQVGSDACPKGSIRIWKYRTEDLIEEACSRLPRNLTRDEWVQYVDVFPYQEVCDNLPIEPESTVIP